MIKDIKKSIIQVTSKKYNKKIEEIKDKFETISKVTIKILLYIEL